VAKIPTDSGKGDELPKTGGVANLLTFVELFIGQDRRQELEKLYASSGIRYGEVKKELAAAIYKELEPIQTKREELARDTEYVDKVITEGAQKARAIASQTVKEVKEKMGF